MHQIIAVTILQAALMFNDTVYAKSTVSPAFTHMS